MYLSCSVTNEELRLERNVRMHTFSAPIGFNLLFRRQNGKGEEIQFSTTTPKSPPQRGGESARLVRRLDGRNLPALFADPKGSFGKASLRDWRERRRGALHAR